VPRASADIFRALADPTRRALLDLLRRKEQPVSQLVQRFAISQPGISQHLRVLRGAGLVRERRQGRLRLYRLQPERLQEAADWLARYEPFWRRKLWALGEHLDKTAPAPERTRPPREKRRR
jgi:DNA-binding transcriptional ArsR family regulator